MDRAYARYYRDQISRDVFKWIQQYRTLVSIYDERVEAQLEHTPFPPERWAELEAQAKAMGEGVSRDYPGQASARKSIAAFI